MKDCLSLDGDDLVITVPSGGKVNKNPDIDTACRWWGEGPIWVIWPAMGDRRSIELRDKGGNIVFWAIIGPLFKGPYTTEEAVKAGRIVHSLHGEIAIPIPAKKELAA